MNSTDIEMMIRRADAADKRMQHLQKQIYALASRCNWLEQELIAMGKTVDIHEADIQKLTGKAP